MTVPAETFAGILIGFTTDISYTHNMMEIRKYEQRDRDTVVTICHRTGYFGEDAAPYFKDAELFGLLFTAYYLDYEPEHCFVADDNGKAVDLIISFIRLGRPLTYLSQNERVPTQGQGLFRVFRTDVFVYLIFVPTTVNHEPLGDTKKFMLPSTWRS
jgi:hypothetical protein